MSERSSTKNKRLSWSTLLAAIGLVALGISVGRYFNPAEAAAPSAAHREQALEQQGAIGDKRLAALEQEVQRLRAAETRRSLLPGEIQAERVAPPAEPPNNAAPEEINEEERNRREQAARRQYLDGLSDKLDTEPFDPTWRVETERMIADVVPASFGPDITLEQATCASTLCRIKLNHPKSDHLPKDKMSSFALDRGALESMQIQIDTDNKGSTTLYLLRAQPPDVNKF